MKVWTHFPLTTSCGRLFDGVASLLLRTSHVSYDGEAAMELENAAKRHNTPLHTPLFFQDGAVIDWSPLVRELCPARGTAHLELARAFHSALAAALAGAAEAAAEQTESCCVALSGGCWQNALLLDDMLPLLRRRGLEPLTHRLLSPNDECVSVGQAYIGGIRLAQ